MASRINRRQFVASAAGLAAAAAPASAPARPPAGPAPAAPAPAFGRAPAVQSPRGAAPVVIASANGHRYTNGGTETCVEIAFRLLTSGADVLDALVAGVNVVELDPEDASVGYGGRPNADGVVQLDACCMHGPKRRAGGVAALEGVRTPSRVAQAVADLTDHHLLVGPGAQRFARQLGFPVEDDLNTDRSRRMWLEWKRRTDPGHYLDPDRGANAEESAASNEDGSGPAARRHRVGRDAAGRGVDRELLAASNEGGSGPAARRRRVERDAAGRDVDREMLADGVLTEDELYGTINCDGVNAAGDVCGVTTTSGLAWKIPGRVGDSPILGAGLYVDNEVGAAGSTGRGEANLYNLASFLIVERMRAGMHPLDAGMEALRRVRANTVEPRLLNGRGLPAFGLSFYVLDRQGRHAGVSLYAGETSRYAVCAGNGPELLPLEPLLAGSPRD